LGIKSKGDNKWQQNADTVIHQATVPAVLIVQIENICIFLVKINVFIAAPRALVPVAPIARIGYIARLNI